MSLDWTLNLERVGWAVALMAAYLLLCARVVWVSRRKRLEFAHSSDELAAHSQWPAVLVTFASQTGQAESLARATADMLSASGFRVKLLPVEFLTEEVLKAHPHSLWMVSTTGEGDAPDQALPFVQHVLPMTLDLRGHQCQVLALGDREYTQFCEFGEIVHAWLIEQGAESDLVCVDNMERATLLSWQAKINVLRQRWGGADPGAAEILAQNDAWLIAPASAAHRLLKRSLLNAGSSGGALYLLEWTPVSGEFMPWESGDLVSLAVPAEPQQPRDYSIASVMQDGSLQMLVRQSVRADGSPGVASSWLCEGMPVGDLLDLSVRAHGGFRLGDNAMRPLILIGNGSGLAGLLSHIRSRIAQGRGDQWLIFGERSPQHDAIFGEQLAKWQREGGLQCLDLAWSRTEPAARAYVQDIVLAKSEQVKDWMARDAAIYVCGSLQGMGHGVHLALKQVLGESAVQDLMRAGRYRRDVY